MTRVLGVTELVVLVALALVTARSVRHAALPLVANRARVIVADAVVTVSVLVVASELLGAVGGLRLPLLDLLVGVAALAARARWGAPPRAPLRAPVRPGPFNLVVAAVALVPLTMGCRSLLYTLQGGTTDIDSQWYHLTVAAHAAQRHSWAHLYLNSTGDPTAYYPFNVESLHALGLLATGNAVLSPLVAVGSLALAWTGLVASTLPGRSRTVAAILFLALLSTPITALVIMPTSMTDIATIALVFAAVALLVPPAPEQPSPVLGGLAVGLAVGTKLNAAGPVVVLAVLAVVLLPRLRGWRPALQVAGAAALTGSFWYVRDWVVTGTPLPETRLPVLRQVHYVFFDKVEGRVSDVLLHPGVWRRQLLPGFSYGMSPWWPFVIGVPLLVCALCARRGRDLGVLGVTGLAAAVIYAITPSSLGPLIGDSRPLFGGTTRYLDPAIVIGVVAAGRVAWPAWVDKACLVGTGGVVWVLAERTGMSVTASVWVPSMLAALALAVLGVAIWASPTGVWRLAGRAAVTAVVLVTLVASAMSLRTHDQRRTPAATEASLWSFAQDLRHQRIGVVGAPLQYGFFGPGLTNHVVYLGHDDGGVLVAHPTCRSLLAQVVSERLDYLVVEHSPVYPAYETWVVRIPHLQVVTRPLIPGPVLTARAEVLKLPAVVDPASCGAA